MMLRSDHFGPDSTDPGGPCPATRGAHAESSPRLNLLLSSAHWRYEPAFEQLPHLLAPLGIRSITASSGEEAADVIHSVRVHIAIVDLSVPMQRLRPPSAPGVPAATQPCNSSAEASSQSISQDMLRFALTAAGPRVLQLLRRLDAPPPTVVVRPPQAAARDSARGLTEALREGAFAVLDRPVPLEAMLEVLRRIVRRHYADSWPR